MKVYKGTDKDMKCRGMQYEVGKTYEADGAVRCGSVGLHSCKAPFDVLKYYGLKAGNRYFEAEAGGLIDEEKDSDSKIASSKLMIKTEIGLPGLIKAQMEYVREKAEKRKKGGWRSNLAGGWRSNIAGGDDSNLAGGDCSNLAGGDCSNLAGGDGSLIVGRNGCKAKGGINSVLVLTAWEFIGDEYKPVVVKAVIVDGEKIKADTWYELIDGEIKEALCNEN